jgi:hypothetical protein
MRVAMRASPRTRRRIGTGSTSSKSTGARTTRGVTTDTADGATIFANIWNADEQALADATVTARHLIESGGVRRVFRYDTKTGVFGREVQP